MEAGLARNLKHSVQALYYTHDAKVNLPQQYDQVATLATLLMKATDTEPWPEVLRALVREWPATPGHKSCQTFLQEHVRDARIAVGLSSEIGEQWESWRRGLSGLIWVR